MHESIQLVLDSAPFLLKGALFTLQLSLGGMFFSTGVRFYVGNDAVIEFLAIFTSVPLLCLDLSWHPVNRPTVYDLLWSAPVWY